MGMRDIRPEGGQGPTRRGLLDGGARRRDGGRHGRLARGRAGPAGRGAAARRRGRPQAAQARIAALPGPAAGRDTLPLIRHIVVLMMENHSYDNKLGMLKRPGADGFTLGKNGKPTATNPYKNGKIQHAFRMPTTCQLSGQPAQDWLDSHIQYDHGKLDGFVESGSGPVSMGYWQKQDQPFYYSLASTFPIADRYFCSVLGQTFPNRRYLMAATSLGMVNDTLPSGLPGARDDLRPARRAPHHVAELLLHDAVHAAVPERLLRQLRHQGPPAGAVLHRTPPAGTCPATASSTPTTARTPKRTRRTSRSARRSRRRSSARSCPARTGRPRC